jgi:hypothetical protein
MNGADGPWGAAHIARYRERVFAERDRLGRAFRDPAARQWDVLTDLLDFNAETAFGREHGFGRIRTLADFRQAVPIRDYAALSPWIDRMADGEANVLTADDPVVYFTSSGSTGAHKKVPVTARFMRTTFFPFFYAAWAPLIEHFPDVLSAPDAVLNLKFDPAPVVRRTAAGRPHLGASQVDFGEKFGEPLSAEPGTSAPWTELPPSIAADDHLGKSYARLRRAVESDVRCVIGINPAMVAALPYQLRLWWPRIVKDVHDGTVDGRPHYAPNPERARELEWLAERFTRIRPAHIWPHMRAIFCWTSGLASLYLPRLREEYGTGVTVLPAPVAASEGPVGVALDRHGSAGSLVVTAAVYEFVPAEIEAGPDVATLEPHELEPGHDYHVVFSHVGGLYRYAVGDVVRVSDTAGGVPRLEYAGRNTLSDACGERLRESQVIRAMAAALGMGGLDVRNAACHVRTREGLAPRYEFALAPPVPFSTEEAGLLGVRLDEALGREAPEYFRARASGRLGPLALRQLDGEAFLRDWHEEVGRGTRPAQVKDRLFRRDPAAWDRLTGSANTSDRKDDNG